MHRIIFTTFLLMMIATTPVLSMQNMVNTTMDCEEFKQQANFYHRKSITLNLYSDRYRSIAENFEKMYTRCLKKTKQNKPYHGYRDNIIQQKKK